MQRSLRAWVPVWALLGSTCLFVELAEVPAAQAQTAPVPGTWDSPSLRVVERTDGTVGVYRLGADAGPVLIREVRPPARVARVVFESDGVVLILATDERLVVPTDREAPADLSEVETPTHAEPAKVAWSRSGRVGIASPPSWDAAPPKVVRLRNVWNAKDLLLELGPRQDDVWVTDLPRGVDVAPGYLAYGTLVDAEKVIGQPDKLPRRAWFQGEITYLSADGTSDSPWLFRAAAAKTMSENLDVELMLDGAQLGDSTQRRAVVLATLRYDLDKVAVGLGAGAARKTGYCVGGAGAFYLGEVEGSSPCGRWVPQLGLDARAGSRDGVHATLQAAFLPGPVTDDRSFPSFLRATAAVPVGRYTNLHGRLQFDPAGLAATAGVQVYATGNGGSDTGIVTFLTGIRAYSAVKEEGVVSRDNLALQITLGYEYRL